LPDADVIVTAEQLAMDFSADQKEAEKKYGGDKKVRVVGVVEEVGSVGDNTSVKLKGDGKLIVSCGFIDTFQKEDVAKAKTFKKGQKVTLQGIYGGTLPGSLAGKPQKEVNLSLCRVAD